MKNPKTLKSPVVSPLAPPLWVKKLQKRVRAADKSDSDVFFLLRYKCTAPMSRVLASHTLLTNLENVRIRMEARGLADADARVSRFVLNASMGYVHAQGAFQLAPSKRAPRIEGLARDAHALANKIEL